jgi:hypothetical protein
MQLGLKYGTLHDDTSCFITAVTWRTHIGDTVLLGTDVVSSIFMAENSTLINHLIGHRVHNINVNYCLILWGADNCTLRSESRCALLQGVGNQFKEPQLVNIE